LCGGPCGEVLFPALIGEEKLTRSEGPFERGKGLKEIRPLWPPQRGVGLREPNLGKTNPCVTLSFACDLFCALSRGLIFISNANPACSCVYILKISVSPYSPPPSRRLSLIKWRRCSTLGHWTGLVHHRTGSLSPDPRI
jgi:hypothetical protein